MRRQLGIAILILTLTGACSSGGGQSTAKNAPTPSPSAIQTTPIPVSPAGDRVPEPAASGLALLRSYESITWPMDPISDRARMGLIVVPDRIDFAVQHRQMMIKGLDFGFSIQKAHDAGDTVAGSDWYSLRYSVIQQSDSFFSLKVWGMQETGSTGSTSGASWVASWATLDAGFRRTPDGWRIDPDVSVSNGPAPDTREEPYPARPAPFQVWKQT